MNVLDLQDSLRKHTEETGHDVSRHVSRGTSMYGITLPTLSQLFEFHHADKPLSENPNLYNVHKRHWDIPAKYTQALSSHPLENGMILEATSHSYKPGQLNLALFGRQTTRDLKGNEKHEIDYGYHEEYPDEDYPELGLATTVSNAKEFMDYLRNASSFKNKGMYVVEMPRSADRVRPMEDEERQEHTKNWPMARLAQEMVHYNLFGDFSTDEGFHHGDGRRYVSHYGVDNPLKYLMVHQYKSPFPYARVSDTQRHTHYYDANTEQLFSHPENKGTILV